MAPRAERAQLAVKTWLVDTGPLVAYIDRADPMHESVVGRLEPFSGRLVTIDPVITESMHLLADARDGPMRGRANAPQQFVNLSTAVAQVFFRREQSQTPQSPGRTSQLSGPDGDVFLEVFWDLFREGIITLGSDGMNREFPFFSVSRLGRRLLENQDTYFFRAIGVTHDEL